MRIKSKITYGTAAGNDHPVAPKYEIRTKKGNYCTVYIRSELNPDCPNAISRGYKYKIYWYSLGQEIEYGFRHEWDTIKSNKTPEHMIDLFVRRYGRGRMWIVQDEIVTRK